MKTILNLKFENNHTQVPATYLFSLEGIHFFIHRKVLKVNENGTNVLSEKALTVSEYCTGAALKNDVSRKEAKGVCIDLLNQHGIDKTRELLSEHETINFNPEAILPFANKVPPTRKKSVLGKYTLSPEQIAVAEKEHIRDYPLSNELQFVKKWISFANEVVLLPGYKANIEPSDFNSNAFRISVVHDFGCYKMEMDCIGELKTAIIEAFNIDGAGEYLKAIPVVKVKKQKVIAVPVVSINIETIQIPAVVTTRNGLSIEGYMFIDSDGKLNQYPPAEKIPTDTVFDSFRRKIESFGHLILFTETNGYFDVWIKDFARFGHTDIEYIYDWLNDQVLELSQPPVPAKVTPPKEYDIEDIEKHIAIGFCQPSFYRESVWKKSKRIMDFLVSLAIGVIVYDFGRGKGKYTSINNYSNAELAQIYIDAKRGIKSNVLTKNIEICQP